MSIAALLQAAEYIERREREAEHGYASTMPMPDDMRTVTKRPKTKKSQGSRTTHNELEKNRWVYLFQLTYHHREIDKESLRYSYFNLPFLDNHFDITMNINLSTRSRSNKVRNACYRVVLANISLIRVISIPFITVENSFPNFSLERRHLCSSWFKREF